MRYDFEDVVSDVLVHIEYWLTSWNNMRKCLVLVIIIMQFMIRKAN